MTNTTAPMICLAGKNSIAVDALLFMIDRGWKNRLVICPNRTDDGTSTWQPSLVRFAKEIGIEMIALGQAQEIDDLIFISLEFDQILRPTAFKSNRLYNIHFSALPAYKGMYTSALPILNGSAQSGVTLHEIDHGIDTGAIIAQEIFPLPESWTARDLYFAYLKHGSELFRKNFEQLIAKDAPKATPQPAAGSTYFSKASINYRGLAIDLCNTAEGVVRQLRAFSFREYQTPSVAEMEIGNWRILPERSFDQPGTILEREADSLVVATIDYDLWLGRNQTCDWFALDAKTDPAALDPRNLDISDKMGWTPLIRAAYAGDALLCRRLLEVGADPNRPNTNGTTPLMYALSCPDPAGGREVAKHLLAFGADPKCSDRFGRDLQSYHPNALVGLKVATSPFRDIQDRS